MKILHVIASLDRGGSQSLLMNIFDNIDTEKYNFDFLVYSNKDFDYCNHVMEKGGKIIYIQNPPEIGMFKFIKKLTRIIKENNYDVVHAHTLFNCGPCMLAAYLAGVKIRISHSHSTLYLTKNNSFIKKIYFFLSKLLINIFSNRYIACGVDAGKFLFFNEKKVIILNNGIDINKYSFNENIRKKMRRKYEIKKDDIVIGHVGRLMYIKNQEFLINLMKKLSPNYKLILVGGGEDSNKLKKLVKKMSLSNRIYFSGNVDNSNDYYNMFDIFCFPSLHEGLPFTIIEAQANGLKILASQNISHECNISGDVKFLDIIDENVWVEEILNLKIERKNYNYNIEEKGYSINTTIEKLKEIYSISGRQ